MLAFLMYTNMISYTAILSLSFLLGIITAIDMPARQASISQMIDHSSQLQSALSLQSGSFNLARLVGPAIAGFVINAGGEMACFLANAVAHLAVLYAYCIMTLPPRSLASRSQPALDAIKEGMGYVWKVLPLRNIMFFNYAFCFFAVPYMVLMPIFTREILGGDSRHLGFLMGGIGLGALAGVYYLASAVSITQLPRHIWRMQLLYGIVYALFAMNTQWPVALALSPLIGFAMVSALVSNNSLLQALVDEDKRGRALSLYSFGLLGFGPLGAFLIGKCADLFSVQSAAFASSLVCIALALLHGTRHRVYKRFVPQILADKGIA
jgi:MFS family permease